MILRIFHNFFFKLKKEKYFRLSQSTSLFEELKSKLERLLKKNLTNDNLNDILHKYSQLIVNYENLFDKVKSKVKLRKAKYESYLQTWREFDLNCKQLDELFSMNNPESLTNLEFRSLVIEMNTCLAKIKEHHGTLTSICPEKKYFEMKDLIIFYELKLKKFKEDYEARNFITKSIHTTSDVISTGDISNNDINVRLNIINKNPDKTNKHVNGLNQKTNLVTDEKCFIKTPIAILNNSSQEISGFHIYDNENGQVNGINQNKHPKIYVNQKVNSNHVNRLNPRANEFYKNASPYSDCEHHDFFDNVTPEISPKKKVETSDKSTATINDMATQTDAIPSKTHIDPSGLSVINEKSTKSQPTNNYFNHLSNEHRYNNVDRAYLKKSKFSKHNRESDGKKLLLEAYLRNNENITNGGSTTSSGKAASSTLSMLHANKKGSLIKIGVKNTLESGIGTTNDDEVDSLQSIHNEYDYICELKHHETNEQSNSEKENESYYDTDLFATFKPSETNNNNSDLENENSETNLIKRNDLYAKKEKLLKKKAKQKLQNKQSSNDENFTRSNSSNLFKQTSHLSSSYEKESSTKLREVIIPNDQDIKGNFMPNGVKSAKSKNQEEDHLVKDEDTEASYYTFSWFLKRILAIIFYLFPLGLLFLLVIYYFFVYYLNPSCCDYQRNYLMWNII